MDNTPSSTREPDRPVTADHSTALGRLKLNSVGDVVDKTLRLQLASDKIAHLSETLLAVGKELDTLCVSIGADLFEKVEAAYPGHDSVTVAAHKLDALARSLEPPDY